MQKQVPFPNFTSKYFLLLSSMILLLLFKLSSTNCFIITSHQGVDKVFPQIGTRSSFSFGSNDHHCSIFKNFDCSTKNKKIKRSVIRRSGSINQEDVDDRVDDVSSYQDEVNVLCNEIVRAILAGDEYKVKQLRYKVEDNHSRLCGFDENTGKVQSPQMWLFLSSLLKVMEHDLHQDADKLEGHYSESYLKIIGLIEDSGWQLTEPVEQVSG